jgi:hypothetical protein
MGREDHRPCYQIRKARFTGPITEPNSGEIHSDEIKDIDPVHNAGSTKKKCPAFAGHSKILFRIYLLRSSGKVLSAIIKI